MNSMTQIIAHFFLFALSYGIQLFAPVVDSKLTGVGFYKLGTSIVLACLVLALGIDTFMEPGISGPEFACYGFLILSNVFTYIFHKDLKTSPMWLMFGLQVIIFGVLTFNIFVFNPLWVMFFYLSMTLLGITNFSMILGHYYLVVPKLTEEPLIYCLYIFWTALFLRLISSLAVILSLGIPYLEEGAVLGDGYLYNWLFISMRYLWGYLAPLVLSFFTFRLCRMRSIQSATGVLYIIVFFVIVGELISIYLMGKHGLPL